MMLGASADLDVRLRALVEAAAEGEGTLDRALRRKAVRGEPMPEPLDLFATRLARGGLSPQDVEAMRRAGYTADQLFELAIALALGWAKARLDAGLRALGEAEDVPAPSEKEDPA